MHSPVDIRKDETDRFDNAIDVMTKSFLGMTVACARCHDHKFDAISTRDYYALYGYLQSSNYHQVRFESMEQNRSIAAKAEQLHQRQQALLKAKLKAAFQDEVQNFSRYYQSASELVRQTQSPESEQLLQTQAAKQELNPAILKRWVAFLQNNKSAEEELKAAIMLEAGAPASLAPASPFDRANRNRPRGRLSIMTPVPPKTSSLTVSPSGWRRVPGERCCSILTAKHSRSKSRLKVPRSAIPSGMIWKM